MSNFKKLAHSVCECKYHFVWCPKYRFRVLRRDIGRSGRRDNRAVMRLEEVRDT